MVFACGGCCWCYCYLAVDVVADDVGWLLWVSDVTTIHCIANTVVVADVTLNVVSSGVGSVIGVDVVADTHNMCVAVVVM